MSIYYQHEQFLQPDHAVKHGFFGSQGGVSKGLYTALNCGLGSDDNKANVRANRVLALEALGLEKTYLHNVHQIHSVKCIPLAPANINETPEEADALVTDIAGHTISILTADCTPVLFYGTKESGAPVIGAAHAGWKGAVGGVLENTVQAMLQKGCVIGSIRAAIGPTIGVESYEVGTEFKSNLLSKNKENKEYFVTKNQQIFFNLPAFCEARMRAIGVSNIYQKNLDTFFNEDDFFSYRRATHRRDKDYGRQISMIAIT